MNEKPSFILHFPDPMESAAEQAHAFRQLSSQDRLTEIIALMQFGLNMARSSPRREAIEQRWLDQEQEWQKIQQKLFAQHGS